MGFDSSAFVSRKGAKGAKFCLIEEHSGKSHPALREGKGFLYLGLGVIPACFKQGSMGLKLV
jgi:hypothetical protein